MPNAQPPKTHYVLQQEFTDQGKTGVKLFMFSPIVSGLSFA